MRGHGAHAGGRARGRRDGRRPHAREGADEPDLRGDAKARAPDRQGRPRRQRVPHRAGADGQRLRGRRSAGDSARVVRSRGSELARRFHVRPLRHVHRDPLRESLPALVGAADRVGGEHPPRLRGGLGGSRDQDDRRPPGRQRKGPKTNFMRTDPASGRISMKKRPGAALHSSWNWELISDKPLDWWIGRLARIKKAHPEKILIASIMAGSGSDEELRHWQTLAKACQDDGADALELNLSCPHMDRPDMGSNIGKDDELISVVTQVVKEVARVPVWAKLTPVDDRHRRRGARRVPRRRRRDLLVQHVHVAAGDRPRDPRVRDERRGPGLDRRPRRAGDPSPLAREDGADDAARSRTRSSRGSAASPSFAHALNYFLLGCGTVQVCTAAMLDHAVGPNVIKSLVRGMEEFLEKNAHRGWKTLDDFRGIRRDRIVSHSQIKRPDEAALPRRLRERGAGRRREHEVTARLSARRHPERVSARDLSSPLSPFSSLSLSAAPAAKKAPRTPKQYTIEQFMATTGDHAARRSRPTRSGSCSPRTRPASSTSTAFRSPAATPTPLTQLDDRHDVRRLLLPEGRPHPLHARPGRQRAQPPLRPRAPTARSGT